MTDPYQHQYGQQPVWSQQAPAPRRPRGSSRRVRIFLVSILGVCVLCLAAGLAGAIIGRGGSSTDSPAGPTPSSSKVNPPDDVGAGTPGAGCATDRLGKTFTKDGVTYTCKGPKPYSWRP